MHEGNVDSLAKPTGRSNHKQNVILYPNIHRVPEGKQTVNKRRDLHSGGACLLQHTSPTAYVKFGTKQLPELPNVAISRDHRDDIFQSSITTSSSNLTAPDIFCTYLHPAYPLHDHITKCGHTRSVKTCQYLDATLHFPRDGIHTYFFSNIH